MSMGVDLAAGSADEFMKKYKGMFTSFLGRGAVTTGLLVGGAAAGVALTVGVVAFAGVGGVVKKFVKGFKEQEIDELKRKMDLANSRSADDPWVTWTHLAGPGEELAERLQDELSEVCVESQVENGALMVRAYDSTREPAMGILAKAGMVMSIADPEPEKAAERIGERGEQVNKLGLESALTAEKLARAMKAKGYLAYANTERTDSGKVVPTVSYVAAREGTGEDMRQATEIAALKADIEAHPERYAPAVLTKRSRLDGKSEVDMASVMALKDSYARAGAITPEAAERFERAAAGLDERPTPKQVNYLAGLVAEGVVPEEAVDIARGSEVTQENVSAYLDLVARESQGASSYEINKGSDLGLFGKLASQSQTKAQDAYVGQNGQRHEASVTHAEPTADVPATDRKGDVPAMADVDGDGLLDSAEDIDGNGVADDRESRPGPFRELKEMLAQAKQDAASYNEMQRDAQHGRADRSMNDRTQ